MNAVVTLLALALAADVDPQSVAWRAKLESYASEHLQHPAWGPEHAKRNYTLALALAKEDGVALDEEALFAASLVHDVGAIEPFLKPGVEHMARGLELVDAILEDSGFPHEKIPLVRTILGNHMFFSDPAKLPPTALYFRDADTLDFLGAVGAARIFTLVGRHRWAPDFNGAIATVRKNMTDLPSKLATPAGRKLAPQRVEEMERFLTAIEAEK